MKHSNNSKRTRDNVRQGMLRIPNCGRTLIAAVIASSVLLGCHQDMWNQPKLNSLAASEFFADNRGSRDAVPGTVQYDGARRTWIDQTYVTLTNEPLVPSLTDATFWSGKTTEGFKPDNYFEVNRTLLERGRERYNISCMPCHGAVGDGRGVIAARGFPSPASYHTERLREVEDGYIFDVITNGFGRMYSYAARVQPEDRWAIAAYIRALQASQNIDITDRNSQLAQEVMRGLEEQAQRESEAAVDHHHDAANADGEAASDHSETADGEASDSHAE